MRRSFHLPFPAAALAVSLASIAAPLAAQDSAIPPRDERTTKAFVAYFERAESWPIRGLALLSFGSHWHPVGASAITAALEDRDERTLPFAVEALRRTREDVLRAVANEELIEALLDVTRSKHPLLHDRSIDAVRRIAGDAEIEDRRDAERWWRQAKRDGWKPAEWPPIPAADGESKETTTGVLDRAFDLRETGLDVVIVIDATGSMQLVIDEAVRALDDVIELLGEIAPELRVGVVEYRDFGDMKDGADLVTPLKRNVRQVQKELAKVRAAGGGDAPERVEKGLEVALHPKMGWRPETNKLVLVVGDAPPHPETETGILELVREAHERPSIWPGRESGPTTGPRDDTFRPYVISTISAHQMADRPFKEIAEAGGGTFAQLGERGQQRLGGPGAGPEAPRAKGPKRNPAEAISSQVLVDSFGSQFRDATRSMLAIWFEYRAAAEEARRR